MGRGRVCLDKGPSLPPFSHNPSALPSTGWIWFLLP